MAKNVRLHFLYRDSGNYKKFGHKDFGNPMNLSVDEIHERLKSCLIDGMFFYPEKVNIQKFRFHRYCDDYSWYEVEAIELIESNRSCESICEFINLLQNQ